MGKRNQFIDITLWEDNIKNIPIQEDDDLKYREVKENTKISIEDYCDDRSCMTISIAGDNLSGLIDWMPTNEEWSVLLRMAVLNLHGQV